MADNREAKELHLTATIEGENSLNEDQLEDKVERILKQAAGEAGVKVSDVHVVRVGEEEPGIIESETDWLGE